MLLSSIPIHLQIIGSKILKPNRKKSRRLKCIETIPSTCWMSKFNAITNKMFDLQTVIWDTHILQVNGFVYLQVSGKLNLNLCVLCVNVDEFLICVLCLLEKKFVFSLIFLRKTWPRAHLSESLKNRMNAHDGIRPKMRTEYSVAQYVKKLRKSRHEFGTFVTFGHC